MSELERAAMRGAAHHEAEEFQAIIDRWSERCADLRESRDLWRVAACFATGACVVLLLVP